MSWPELTVPICGAPMAGGPSTPALAAAVTEAGGLGFLAAGYLSAARLAEDIVAARRLTTGPLGVNLFVPQPSVTVPGELDAYREALQPLAEHYGVAVGEPRVDDDDWAAKLEVVADLRPEVVSFTFGAPSPAVPARLRELGITTLMTVTTAAEAVAAVDLGFDALVVQGPEAGGHRGSWQPDVQPPVQPLLELLAAVLAHTEVPVIAAGGLVDPEEIAGVLRVGARGVQVGTALLATDEAGTNPVHRSALLGGRFGETAVTRAFSGRYARGLVNEFIVRYDQSAPSGYPQVHYMTAPIRRAAVAAGDPHGTNLWAGTGFGMVRSGPVAAVLAHLAAGLAG